MVLSFCFSFLPMIGVCFDTPLVFGVLFLCAIPFMVVAIIFFDEYTKYRGELKQHANSENIMHTRMKSLISIYNKILTNGEILEFITGYIGENVELFQFRYLDYLVPVPDDYLDLYIIGTEKYKNMLMCEFNDITPYSYMVELLKDRSVVDFINDMNNNDIIGLKSKENNSAVDYIYPFFDSFNNDFLDALISAGIIENNFENKYAILCLVLKLIRQSYHDSFIEDVISKYDLKDNMDFNYYVHEMLEKDNIISDCVFIFQYNAYENIGNSIVRTNNWALNNYFPILINGRESINKKVYLNRLKQTAKSKDENLISISDIDLMSGKTFEYYICDLLIKMGFGAEVTKLSGDQGADIIAEKDGFKYVIQVKCYKNMVSNKAIQEVVASKKIYNAQKALVVTNSHFTKSAKELAEANNVLLWDREILKEKINQNK